MVSVRVLQMILSIFFVGIDICIPSMERWFQMITVWRILLNCYVINCRNSQQSQSTQSAKKLKILWKNGGKIEIPTVNRHGERIFKRKEKIKVMHLSIIRLYLLKVFMQFCVWLLIGCAENWALLFEGQTINYGIRGSKVLGRICVVHLAIPPIKTPQNLTIPPIQ